MDAAPYTIVEQAGPGVRRVLARNPSAFTSTGTQTHIVGRGDVAVIDPGPALPEHVDALLGATAGEQIAAIFVTHTHRDHSPAARLLAAACGAPVIGCAPISLPDAGGFSESFDLDYAPDRILADGETVEGAGWSLSAVATPGHMSNHLCFAYAEERALFSGDHVMGWSTSVILPPDGSMAAYMASLAKLAARDDAVYYPAHGPSVDAPAKLVRGLIAHRKAREVQILRVLAEAMRIEDIVAGTYAGLDPKLIPAAAASVHAHLIDLEARGLVRVAGDSWSLV